MRSNRAPLIFAATLAIFTATTAVAQTGAPPSPDTAEDVVFWLPSGSRVLTVTVPDFAKLLVAKLRIRSFRALARAEHDKLTRDLAPLRVSVNGMKTRLGNLRAGVLAAQLIRGASGMRPQQRPSAESLRELARSVKAEAPRRPEA